MARYDILWSTMATRAVRQGGIDADTFLRMADVVGMSESEVVRRLLSDLENDGPIFGKFLRSLSGAASSAVLAAERQGVMAGQISGSDELRRLTDLADVDDVIEDADPEALQAIEDRADRQEFDWIATLRNTCHRCLPLHGKRFTMAEWRSLGYLPETIHDGWASTCHCQLTPSVFVQDEMVTPLVRLAQKGSKKTARAVGQADIEKAVAAVERIRATDEGRNTLAALGNLGDRG